MVQVLLSNAKTVSIAVSLVSTRVGDIGIAKSTLQAMSSAASTFAYAGVCELVARRSARWAPSAKPITPILSALYPRSAAAWRTRRTARCPSSQATWYAGSPAALGRWRSHTQATPLARSFASSGCSAALSPTLA